MKDTSFIFYAQRISKRIYLFPVNGTIFVSTFRTIHMSTVNLTNKVRISCDTRWQPKSHKADSRYVGEMETSPKKLRGDWAKCSPEQEKKEYLTIEKLKEMWGFL